MVDVSTFWQSLKCTWVRRLLVTDAFWPEILNLELLKNGSNLHKILNSGPSYLQNVAKNIKNKFWKNCIFSLANVSRDSSFSNPEKFYLFNIFQNPLFKFARKPLPWANYGNPRHRITQVCDFYKFQGILYSLIELNGMYNTSMTQSQLDRIHVAIQAGLASLNLNIGVCEWHPLPRQSNIISIANQNQKGCKAFYKILRAKADLDRSARKIEEKWHAQLDANLSVTFWNNAWRLHASMQCNNQLKWLQCQILRNCLFTNNRVTKFKPWVTDRCDLCGLHIENPLTLFSQCSLVLEFWSDIKKYCEYFGHDLPIGRLQILFGVHNEKYDSVKNIAILIGKRTIWISKFKKISPTLEYFKNQLKDYLIILSLCHNYKNTSSVFVDQWGSFYWLLQGNHGPQLPPRDEQAHG